jgi:HK97 family phage portal protein
VDSSGLRELWHIKTFNIMKQPSGTSIINYILYEIRQHLEGSKHNLSTLLKGARLSGILFSENELLQDKRENMVKEMRSVFQGSNNAGAIGFLEGGKFDFKAMSESMKDMDFKELKKDVTIAIYNAMEVPLALMLADTMTLDNLKQAKELLYDNAVIPLGRRMYQELTMLLMPRFKIQDGKLLQFNIGTISALEDRRTRRMESMSKTNAFTVNEVRDVINYSSIENGDDIYIPLNLVPLGADTGNTGEIKGLSKEQLRSYIDSYGRQLFTDEEIEDIKKTGKVNGNSK